MRDPPSESLKRNVADLASVPQTLSAHSTGQTIIALADAGRAAEAEALVATIGDTDLRAAAWQVIARGYAKIEEWSDALRAIEEALRLTPSLAARLDRALFLQELGRGELAIAQLRALAAEVSDDAEVTAHLARALMHTGDTPEAERVLRAGLQRWPTHPQLHISLSRLLWQRGAGEGAVLPLEQAIQRYPRELHLRLIAADLLRKAGFLPRALTLLEDGLALAPNAAGFLTSVGVVLDDLQRPAEALPYLQAALARAPSSVPAKRNLIPTLLRLTRAGEARAMCEALLQQFPSDQQLIAYHATALRMLNDPVYAELHDYERLVRIYELHPPPAFKSIEDFNSAFAAEVLRLHGCAQHPLDQSLRGGTQTQRNLPRGRPVIDAFFAMIDPPIRDYIEHLREGSRHPTDRRRAHSYRIAGSWSVRLDPGGFHINHVHPMGWLSSAYYIELPAQQDAHDRAGWLKFGEPGSPIPGCGADYFVQPRPGLLVLFPSYMWHGTVPFREGARRLTAAFDVIPA